MITFWVDGIPAPQGSKRHVGNGRLIESSKALPAWRKAIEDTVRHVHKDTPIDRPVTVRADFFMPKPKKPMFPLPATAPDLDKLQRGVGDGLEKGGLLANDSRIVQWVSTKHYGPKTGCQITVTDYRATVTHMNFQETS